LEESSRIRPIVRNENGKNDLKRRQNLSTPGPGKSSTGGGKGKDSYNVVTTEVIIKVAFA